MISLLVNIGIFVLMCLFLLIIFIAPLTSGCTIVFIYLSTKGIAGYYFAWFKSTSSGVPEVFATMFLLICIILDAVILKERIRSLN